jgi:hypothetical protein
MASEGSEAEKLAEQIMSDVAVVAKRDLKCITFWFLSN